MLVLSRKTSERIFIGRPGEDTLVTLTVIRIGPNNVRIGIDAPDELAIIREELADAYVEVGELATAPRTTDH